MTVHMISVRLSYLTNFLFFFFMQCFVLLLFISLYTLLRLTEEERAKATSKKGNRRLCCRVKEYENLFLLTQIILLCEIVAHEASSDYGM